ncbi:MAG: hypothetical protein EOP52_12460 [Sphingobacteriales bacterium]|nr:MAG: hypothetical protein EOP52_12460 [Sphingobacteriales bacterium]
MGARYGSAASSSEGSPGDFFQHYESVTRKEYETAVEKDIPIYILIERSVYAEYETYKNNRENKSIVYAHVNSVNVFRLVEQIFAQKRNNPVQTFEKHQDIEIWLREQWAGLFKDLLSRRSETKQIASLSDQVDSLAESNKTLKKYLEEVLKASPVANASQIIDEEEQRLTEVERKLHFSTSRAFKNAHTVGVDLDNGIEILKTSKSVDEIIHRLFSSSKLDVFYRAIVLDDIANPNNISSLNEARSIIDAPPLPPLTEAQLSELREQYAKINMGSPKY